MDAIAPELLENITKEFEDLVEKDEVLLSVRKKIASNTATYQDANQAAIRLGKLLSRAYQDNISSDRLPNGQMYYNIAKRVLEPTLKNNYGEISDICLSIQEGLNQRAKIGIQSIAPDINQDRIDGIIDRISEAPYEKVQWLTKEPIINFSQSIVDDHIRANAEFHAQAGLSPKIVRRSAGRCCGWCSKLAGTYQYPEEAPEGADVWKRHENCRCTVDYDPGDGKVQDVWSKKWKESKEILDERKKLRHTLDIQFFGGKERADQWGANWREVDLEEFIDRWAKDAEITETPQKIKYQTPGSPYIVVVDKTGDYVRLMDTRLPGKQDHSKYVDADGKNIHNVVVNGKIKGLSRSDWQAATHFKFRKKEEEK